jgi:SagB-type dehydrogenase family enzyme
MPKLAWVLIPLAAYVAVLAVLAWRGRAPARMALNVHSSLLLLAYLLTTAGLGIFWVANQQLPVFDWHYLFGYATLLLVSVHLVFNLPIVVRWFGRKTAKPRAPAAGGPRLVGQAVALAAAFGMAYFIGTRQGGDALPAGLATGSDNMPAAIAAVIRYHAYSSASRGNVFVRAPGVEWGSPPPPFKRYSGAETIALARGTAGGATLGDMLRAPASGQGRLDLASLGEMLFLSAGITLQRGGNALRAAPSSGALFPSELYVIARSIDGLAPGVYHYDPEHHRLDVLGPIPRSVGATQASEADAVVVLSALFRRTGYKYHNRAYRYAAADGGHLLENVRLGAHRAGMHAQFLPEFDDAEAARTIAVDGVEEGVLALVALSRKPASQPGPGSNHLAPAASLGATTIGVTGLVQHATSLHGRAAAVGDIVALPKPVPATRDLHDTIAHRRSERRFGAGAMPLSALSSLLADATQASQLSGAVTLNVVSNRVAGLPRGVYRYLPTHALERVRSGDFQAAARSAALSQDVIGDAAAVLILSADRDAIFSQGARGYRHVLIEAGLVGERWLLGAAARGLAACPVGAFYDDEAAVLIGRDPHRHWALHFAAVGLRPEP